MWVDYRNKTSAQSLSDGEAAYSIDLSETTLLEDPSFFDNARDSIQEWLRSDHFGLYGWVWAALGVAALFMFCCACSYCTNWSKKRKAQKAVRRQLDTVLSSQNATYLHQPQRPSNGVTTTGAPPRLSNGANAQHVPPSWGSPRTSNRGVAHTPNAVTRSASRGRAVPHDPLAGPAF